MSSEDPVNDRTHPTDGGQQANHGHQPDRDGRIRTVESRIEDLEADLDETSNAISRVQDNQEQLTESVDELNDTVRQLLGVYGQLTADANPFTEGGDQGGDGDGRFGVFSGAEPADELPESEEQEGHAAESGSDEDAVSFDDLKDDYAGEETDEETVSFDDLKEEYESSEMQREPPRDPRTEERPAPDAPLDDLERIERMQGETRPEPRDERQVPPEVDGYATDILIFEWLSSLVRSGGPAATLQALRYYEEVGWIDHEMRLYLEDVLTGPELDVNVDPGEPTELTTEEHMESYAYTKKLNVLAEF